ncbi:hypothetical protein Mapa_012933 [Marchantia paleacea]|nr:hypothetical protein Mapa_012933 [Marchantia paleacea]
MPTTLANPSGLFKRITSNLHTTAIMNVKTGMAFCIAAANAVLVYASPARNSVCCKNIPMNPNARINKQMGMVKGVRKFLSEKNASGPRRHSAIASLYTANTKRFTPPLMAALVKT